MRITSALLLLSAIVIGLIARDVLADAASDGCPGSVTFNANHVSQLACPATCIKNGRHGVCQPANVTTTVNVWNYDAALGRWVQTQVGNPPQSLTFEGTSEVCQCHVNMGTEEDPNYQDFFNPCCILYRIPAFDGNPVHMVGVKGTCPSGCPGDECKATGANNVVAAECD